MASFPVLYLPIDRHGFVFSVSCIISLHPMALGLLTNPNYFSYSPYMFLRNISCSGIALGVDEMEPLWVKGTWNQTMPITPIRHGWDLILHKHHIRMFRSNHLPLLLTKIQYCWNIIYSSSSSINHSWDGIKRAFLNSTACCSPISSNFCFILEIVGAIILSLASSLGHGLGVYLTLCWGLSLWFLIHSLSESDYSGLDDSCLAQCSWLPFFFL